MSQVIHLHAQGGEPEFNGVLKFSETSFPHILNSVLKLKQVYENHGGTNPITLQRQVEQSIPESEYDQHTDTRFSNTKTQWLNPIFSWNAPRQEVYNAVHKHTGLLEKYKIMRDFNRRWPTERFEDELPIMGSLEVLLKDYHLKPR